MLQVKLESPFPRPLPAGTIAICMATYNPNPELFDVQIRSLLAQADERWVCLISDDCSDPDRFEQIEAVSRRDPRFAVSCSDRRLGFYRNFERALGLVPPEAELVALCDQDDRWYPDKLQTLRARLGGAQLVYSDQRLVDARGRVIRETMWRGRSNNHTNLASMLIANTITGAAMLFRRELLGLALPFPDTPGLQFHDHWLALVALAAGEVAYVDRPLYDYVQHPDAIFGEVTGESPRGRTRSSGSHGWLAARSRGWRAAYFCGYLPRAIQARMLLVRCASISLRKRRALEWYLASERSPLWFAWLAARPLRRLAGRNETLGSELELVPGIVWPRLIPICAKLSTLARRRACDATYPDPLDFEQRRLRRWRAGL